MSRYIESIIFYRHDHLKKSFLAIIAIIVIIVLSKFW